MLEKSAYFACAETFIQIKMITENKCIISIFVRVSQCSVCDENLSKDMRKGM